MTFRLFSENWNQSNNLTPLLSKSTFKINSEMLKSQLRKNMNNRYKSQSALEYRNSIRNRSISRQNLMNKSKYNQFIAKFINQIF